MKFYTFILIFLITMLSCSKITELDTLGSGAFRTEDSTIAKIAKYAPSSIVLENITGFHDLSTSMPPVISQGNQESCTAFAIGYYLQSYNQKREFGHNYNYSTLMSPAFLYNQTNRSIYNFFEGDCNSGADIVPVLTFLKNKGICSLSDMSYNYQMCYNLPSSNAISNAYENRIAEFYNIFHKNYIFVYNISSDKRIEYTKANIQIGTPVILVYQVDANYFINNLPSNNILISSKNNAPFQFHASLVVGFDNAKNAFKIINSYGDQWGEDGYFWMDYDYFIKYAVEAFIVEDYIASIDKIPTIQTMNTITSSSTSGISGGLWLNNKGDVITSKGVCWNTSPNPTILNSITNEGSGDIDFSSLIQGLQSNTTYYVKAYATNSFGTGYGNEHSFTTF